MLAWHHDRRATAQEMLEHPWLKMPANYDFKYTKKEFGIIQLKKEMKKENEPFAADDAKAEMGELVESDEELYQCDSERRCKRSSAA